MKLVVNSNILFSFFRENPVRELIVDSRSFGLELYTPEYALSELKNNKSDITKYAGILALKLDSGIWSNEPRLKRQSAVKVFSTSELRESLSKSKP